MLPQLYMPISLLTVVYKNFTSVMADSLKKCITKVIQPDQTGFLPKTYMKDNVCFIELVKKKKKGGGRKSSFPILKKSF